MEPPANVTTVAEALRAIHADSSGTPHTVVTRSPAGTLVAVGVFGARAKIVWRGLWITPGDVRLLGGALPASVLTTSAGLTGPTALVADLVEAAIASYTERLVDLDERVASWPTSTGAIPLAEMETTHREASEVRRRVGRLVSLVSQLGGPLAASFPDIGRILPELRTESGRIETFSMEIQGALRDIILLRSAEEGNRMSAAAVELGKTSNRISAFANTSNIRMLGIAYLALIIALIGAVVLIPNTTATILGMPSAAWVPGLWVVAILVATAVVPLAVVFTRPWVIALVRELGGFEQASREGIRDLPEVSADAAESTAPEPLLPRSP